MKTEREGQNGATREESPAPQLRELGVIRPFRTISSAQRPAPAHEALWHGIWARFQLRPFGLVPMGFVWRQMETTAAAGSWQYRTMFAPQIRLTLVDGRVLNFLPREGDRAVKAIPDGLTNSPPPAWVSRRPLSHTNAGSYLSRRLWIRQELRLQNGLDQLAQRLASVHLRHEELASQQSEQVSAFSNLTADFNHLHISQRAQPWHQPAVAEAPRAPATLVDARPEKQSRQHEAAAPQLPPAELNRVTDHVLRQIDQRLQAYRERTGRI